MTPEQLTWLSNPEGQEALRAAAQSDPQRLALNAHKQPGKHLSELAEQLQLRSQFRHKFGPWSEHILLTRTAAEQAASYATAQWKATHLQTAYPKVIDICAGLGMDALARAQHGQQVMAIELDPMRAQLLRCNASQLQTALRVTKGDGLAHLADATEDSLICADPDRRAQGGRSLTAADWQPNPLHIVEQMPLHCGCLLKLPPGCDWKTLQEELPGRWRASVLSVRNECKEVLLERVTPNDDDRTLAVTLDALGNELFRWEGGKRGERAQCVSPIQNIFVDPDPAIIRSGYVAEVFGHFQLHLVHPQVAFGHGEDPGSSFPGHRYQVIAQGFWDPKTIKQICKQQGLQKIRVSRRHFPYAPPDILKRLKLKEGGNVHLCCFRNHHDKLFWILGKPCI